MKSFIGYLDKLVNAVSIVLMGSLVFITFFQVVNRFVLKYPIMWTEEIARFLLIWISLIGAALCTREDSHIQIDILYLKLKPKIKLIVSVLINIIFLFLIIFLIWQGTVILDIIRFQKSAASQISMMWVYLAGPISALIMAIYIVRNLIKLFNSKFK